MTKSQYTTLIVTMVIGGLSWSIASFSYLHANFPTKEEQNIARDDDVKRVDRLEQRTVKALEDIVVELRELRSKIR